ncbi:MAG: hypothetical protein RRZ69_04145 [Clostridia bacterium]
MNDFKLRIEFFSKGESVATKTETDGHLNNMSGTTFVESVQHGGKRLCELNATDIKGGIHIVNEKSYPGIVFDNASNSAGICDVGFKITGTKFNNFLMYFDEANNEYATELTVNGVAYKNAKPRFYVVGLNNASEITVRIKKWSKPKFHVKITALSFVFAEEFDKRFIKSLERNSVFLDDNKKPQYGISAQSGKVVLQDRDKVILNYAKEKLLKDGLKFEILLGGRTVGQYVSSNLTYTSLDDEASVDLIDDVTDLQNIIFDGIDFPTVPSEVTPLTALEILTAFYPKKFVMDIETQKRLSEIVVAFPHMEKKDAYKSLIDFCKATGCRVYKNQQGQLCIKAIFW